jgi:hypothetical protein
MIKERNLIALAVIAALAACGGGGGGGGGTTALPSGTNPVIATPTPAAVATPTPVLPAGYAVDAVSITMAKGSYAAASARSAQAIGTGTESIVFTLLQQNGAASTGSPQTFGLTASSAGCTTNPNTGALTCTLPVNAPIGQDVFLAQTYSTANGTGTLTGSGAVVLSVGQNTTNTASIVLNAQVASVVVVAGEPFLGTFGIPGSIARGTGAQAIRRATGSQNQPVSTTINSTQIFVEAADSSGNPILNPSAYNSPIYLQLAFDVDAQGENYYGLTTADVTLSVAYGINDPSPCTSGGSATTGAFYGSFALCSPSDIVTASVSATGGVNPSQDAYVFGYTSATSLLPTPAPNTTPTALPTPLANSFAQITVSFPTPAATCPPGDGCLPVTGQ